MDRPVCLEFGKGGSFARSFVTEDELEYFEGPDTSADAVIPGHGGAQGVVGMSKQPDKSARAELHGSLNSLKPEQNPPGRQVAGCENLMLVVPLSEVGLDYPPPSLVGGE